MDGFFSLIFVLELKVNANTIKISTAPFTKFKRPRDSGTHFQYICLQRWEMEQTIEKGDSNKYCENFETDYFQPANKECQNHDQGSASP